MPSTIVFDHTSRSGADMDVTQFHYEGCGCDTVSGVSPDIAALDRAIWHKMPPAFNTVATQANPLGRAPLRVTYLVPHHNVTGGMKMLMEQMKGLQARGHLVQAVFRGPPGTPVCPPWSDFQPDDAVLLQPTQSWADVLRLLHSDVIMIGFFCQLTDFDGIAASGPILYWEQGHEHVFGDGRSHNLIQYDSMFHRLMSHCPIGLASVSTVVQRTLERQFGRLSGIIPNGIDTTKFYPLPGANAKPTSDERHVLLVGNPGHQFKGFNYALQVLNLVHKSFPKMKVTWVCQVQPRVTGTTFPITFHVNPPQDELPRIYREGKFDAFLFTSRYEAWGMPVLEAFASGIPTVTSQCHGVDMFCRHGHNCLMAAYNNTQLLASHVKLILRNRTYARALALHARQTAEQLTWAKAMDALEDVMYRVHDYHTPAPPPTSDALGSMPDFSNVMPALSQPFSGTSAMIPPLPTTAASSMGFTNAFANSRAPPLVQHSVPLPPNFTTNRSPTSPRQWSKTNSLRQLPSLPPLKLPPGRGGHSALPPPGDFGYLSGDVAYDEPYMNSLFPGFHAVS